MEQNNKMALVVAYYLSKFDLVGLDNLGYKTWTDAYRDVGNKFEVKDTTVNNMRDDFDAVNDNPRAGWHQRELRPSRVNVIQNFQHLSEEAFRGIIQELLSNRTGDDLEDIIKNLNEKDVARDKNSAIFTSRAITGRKAEELFIELFNNGGFPITGELMDTRDLGCGYDFKICKSDRESFIEVKGRAEESGGISFTDKEWEVARLKKNQYYVVIMSNVSDEHQATHTIIENPADLWTPQQNSYTAVQVIWSVSNSDICKL